MSSILCKIWRFFSDLLSQVVEFVANALTTIGTAIVDVLGDLLKEVGTTLGEVFGASPLVWLALGVGAFFLFGKDDDDGNGQHQFTEL